jgi:putative ABC transport system permease protein
MLYLAFRNLFRNPRRSLAILMTIALGAGALFAFKGFITGVLSDYRESTIHSQYGHGQINAKGYRETVYSEPWKHWIDPQEIIPQLQQMPSVAYIFPRINFSALLSNDTVSIGGLGQGIDAPSENAFFHSLRLQNGIGLTDQPEGILLGCGLAQALGVYPGDKITLRVQATDGSFSQAVLTVTDTFKTGKHEIDTKLFRIPLKKAQELLKTPLVESIALGLSDETLKWESIAQNVTSIFPDLEATPFEVLDAIYYQHSVDWLHAQFHVVNCIIITIVLLGIFNTISAAILERKQEIGYFRANGESMWNIMQLILFEGALLAIIGSLFGIAAAYIFLTQCLENQLLMPPGPGLTTQFYITFLFDRNMFLNTALLTTVAAVIASSLAGWKIARMPIATALRAI